MAYLADHSESHFSEDVEDCSCDCKGSVAGGEHLWQHALAHVLGSKDWWDAHYRETTGHAPGAPPCFEVMQRTLGAYAAVTFTAVAEMQRQQVEQRLFGEVTRPKESSPAWAALAAIGQEVRRAVRDARCPDDNEAFNAWSIVSYYVTSRRATLAGADDPDAEKRVRLRNFIVFPPPTPLERTVEPARPSDRRTFQDPADLVHAGVVGGLRMWARRNLRLRGA